MIVLPRLVEQREVGTSGPLGLRELPKAAL